MTKALLKKEWLKIRWIVFLLSLVTIAYLVYLFVTLRSNFFNYEGVRLWLEYTHKKSLFYGGVFRFFAPAFGAVVALFQFIPEARKGRIRLSLHLPLTSDRLLAVLLGIGTGLVLIYGLCIAFILTLMIAHFYPLEIVQSALITSLPWWISGVPAYLAVSLAVLEPGKFRKLVYALLGFFFTRLFWAYKGYHSQVETIGYYTVFSFLFFMMLFLTIFRIKRGAE